VLERRTVERRLAAFVARGAEDVGT
jgi:hypothetical protein